MTAEQQQTIHNPDIQNSAQVSSQFLFSSSVPASDNNNNDNLKRSSSKSRLGADEIDDKSLTGASGCYEGEMERFFQSEVRPVYFGNNKTLQIIGVINSLISMCRWKEWCLFIAKNYSNSRFISKSLWCPRLHAIRHPNPSKPLRTSPARPPQTPHRLGIGFGGVLLGRPNRRGMDAELLVFGV